MDTKLLTETANKLVAPGKGILAADESTGTMQKRFGSIGVESNPENNRIYRQMLFTTSGIAEFISGVILFDETIRQSTDDGIPFPKYLNDHGIVPGIKVDQGKDEMHDSPGEMITKGLDGLEERLKEYFDMGARFTKWRAVYTISDKTPTDECINQNADRLAQYAIRSQEAGLVPIVEPEVLMDGSHDIGKCALVTKKVLKAVFLELSRRRVLLEGMLLKPNMVHPGKDYPEKPPDEEVANATIKIFKDVVPVEVPGIVFLSGGETATDITAHLDVMNEKGGVPWQLSFSFGRALQGEALKAWGGKEENIHKAQKAFYNRAKLDSAARYGKYDRSMEG